MKHWRLQDLSARLIKHTGAAVAAAAAGGCAEILLRFITNGCCLNAFFFQEEAADERFVNSLVTFTTQDELFKEEN